LNGLFTARESENEKKHMFESLIQCKKSIKNFDTKTVYVKSQWQAYSFSSLFILDVAT